MNKKPKVVFISLPFGNKSIPEILEEIDGYTKEVQDCFPDYEVEIINNAIEYDIPTNENINDKLFYRVKALYTIAKADAMYCAGNFLGADGCLTEIYGALLADIDVWAKIEPQNAEPYYYKIKGLDEFNEILIEYREAIRNGKTYWNNP